MSDVAFGELLGEGVRGLDEETASGTGFGHILEDLEKAVAHDAKEVLL